MMTACSTCLLASFDKIGSGQWLLIIAAIIIITMLMMQGSRRRAAGGSPRQYRREIDGATNQSAAIKRDMERLLVELNELARQINGQIDTRFAKLEQSIADADKRIQFLRVLLSAAKEANLVDSDGTEPAGQSPSETGSITEPGRFDVRVGDEGISDHSEAYVDKVSAVSEKNSSPQVPAAAADGQVSEQSPPTEDPNRRLYELADAGRTPVEIARELNQSVGEVELILNLRPQAGGSDARTAES